MELFLPAAIADRSSNTRSCCWGGIFFVLPLDDLVAKSDSNNFGRSPNSKNPDLKKFLSVTNKL